MPIPNKSLRLPWAAASAMKRAASTSVMEKTQVSSAARLSNNHMWHPFTDHQRLNAKGKCFNRADGNYYFTPDGQKVFDGISGLWCVNAGHNQPKIVEAIQKQAATMDYAPCFNTTHPLGPEFAQRLLELVPNRGFEEVFFTMCGSTAVDTAMKIALAYHRAKGNGQKVRFIGRDRAYHGVGFGGVSVGGIGLGRKAFAGNSLPFVDHLPATHSFADMAFSRGQPDWGAHLADDLERLVQLHDASNIAAVVIEPVAGSTGVLPPPKGYLERLRELCTKHDILLIFDEVITGFGRLGASFATEKFNVTPDMITCAKGLTNAAVPAGAVICRDGLFDAIYHSAHNQPEMMQEFLHGYTYSAHPLAMAAGIATLDVYKEQKLFEKANELAPYFEKALHSLKDHPNVIDIRNCGMMGAVELALVPNAPFKRAWDIFDRVFDKGYFIRVSGVSLAMSPPLTAEKHHIDGMIEALGKSIKESAKVL